MTTSDFSGQMNTKKDRRSSVECNAASAWMEDLRWEMGMSTSWPAEQQHLAQPAR